jgi:hypothetical protein
MENPVKTVKAGAFFSDFLTAKAHKAKKGCFSLAFSFLFLLSPGKRLTAELHGAG